MPLKPGKSKATVSENIREFHTGNTYAHTKAKFGKTRADKQSVAVALSEKRRSGRGKQRPAAATAKRKRPNRGFWG